MSKDLLEVKKTQLETLLELVNKQAEIFHKHTEIINMQTTTIKSQAETIRFLVTKIGDAPGRAAASSV